MFYPKTSRLNKNVILRNIRFSDRLYKRIVESFKSFERFNRGRRPMILEANLSWYGKDADGEDQDKTKKVEGIRVQISRLWDKLSQLKYGEKKLSPEEYAKVVASMIKEMDQLITRHGEDKVELAAGSQKDINLIPYHANTPNWLDDAINAGKTNWELINKELKKLNYGTDMSNDTHKQNVRQSQKNIQPRSLTPKQQQRRFKNIG